MDEISIAVGESDDIDLRTIEVGVVDGTIAFTVEGAIRNVDEAVLERFLDRTLRPTEISFVVEDE